MRPDVKTKNASRQIIQPGVSLRIAVAGEWCKVTGEYFERAKPFTRKSLKTNLEILCFKPC